MEASSSVATSAIGHSLCRLLRRRRTHLGHFRPRVCLLIQPPGSVVTEAFQWDRQIVSEPNPGDSWCICMWATASLINRVGCDNVHIRCDATDVDFVLGSYHDGGHRLDSAHECLKRRCRSETAEEL